MVKIIVVEDDKNIQLSVKNILRKLDIFNDDGVKIEYFTKFNPSLKEIINDKENHKIYILDIELESRVSGIDIARYIREKDWQSEIIFITNHDKMFETAYRSVYEVFDFIEKFHDLDKRLMKDINHIFKRNFDNKMFKYSDRNINLQIYYRSITYLYRDKDSRKIIVNTDKRNYSVYLGVSETLNFLDERFKMVHRACIVNVERVQVFNWAKGYFVLDTGEKVSMLSKKYKKEVEEYYGRNN